MSLVDLRWAWVAGGALAALAVPLAILQPADTKTSAAPPLPAVTRFRAPEHTTLALALSAPVFSPSRTVPDPAQPAAGGSGAAAPAQTAPPPLLVGIAGRAKGARIVLLKKNDGSTITASSGDVVDGWQVGRIGRDGVTLTLNGERREAVLNFANKPAAAADAANAPSPTSPPQAEAQAQTPGTSYEN